MSFPQEPVTSSSKTNLDVLLEGLRQDSLAHQLTKAYATASPDEAKKLITDLLEQHLRKKLIESGRADDPNSFD